MHCAFRNSCILEFSKQQTNRSTPVAISLGESKVVESEKNQSKLSCFFAKRTVCEGNRKSKLNLFFKKVIKLITVTGEKGSK